MATLSQKVAAVTRKRAQKVVSEGGTPEEQARRKDLLSAELATTSQIKGFKETGQRISRIGQERGVLEQKRKPLRLRGRRATRVSRATPDLFASSLGQQKQLLGS